MRKLSHLLPGVRDRAVIVGQTGSGKTELARQMLASRPFAVVLDPKRRFEAPGFRTVGDLRALTRARESRIIYRPSHDVLREWNDNGSDIDKFFEWIFRRGNTTVYVDESYLITNRDELPRYYHACLTQGRELEIATWSATQRPMGIPQVILSESEHTYAFRLQLPQDRAKVEAMTGIDRELLNGLPVFNFYYCTSDADAPIGPLMLSLPQVSPVPSVPFSHSA
jgi:hypothetical protein